MSNQQYEDFLFRKTHLSGNFGFAPKWIPPQMFDFQRLLLEWATLKGRAAIYADCGLGKTIIQLTWAENVIRKTNKPVLVLTPLSVAHQTVDEAHKFGIDAMRSHRGEIDGAKVVVTNYQRLGVFDPNQFAGVVCDESSILKNPDGFTKDAVTDFMRKMEFRLLCTATAAPNDYIELGTSSEALGELGFMDMLGRFFKKAEKTNSRKDEHRSGVWRFRGHAERDFWRWVCSWARAVRRPSDLGCSDKGYFLPELRTNLHVVQPESQNPDFLFPLPVEGLAEQRAERRRTLKERCETAASLAAGHNGPTVVWCYLNSEGDLLERLVPDCAQVSGDDSEERKEEVFRAFESGQLKNIVTKPTVAGFGLNWQHCCHQTFFPSHSFEQWYQAIRRSWRFGQKNPVTIDVVTSEGEANVLHNLRRKSEAAEKMFQRLVELMGKEISITQSNQHTKTQTIPAWL